ncbi:MAG: DUF4249 domain-containing protein [Bacteroidales bacterium]
MKLISILLLIITADSCVIPYEPFIRGYEEMIVVEGIITDQPGPYTIKLSKSAPLWDSPSIKYFKGFVLWITDNEGHADTLKSTVQDGVFKTDPYKFTGVAGRTYVLHIKTNAYFNHVNYESTPMKMIPVPPIDSIYYVKQNFNNGFRNTTGCGIYVATHDPGDECRFFKWNYSETWEIRLPFDVPNKVCWVTRASEEISLQNASVTGNDGSKAFPVLTITDPVDRLLVKYSMLVNLYSLGEEEFIYWERFKNAQNQVGGLYDIIPSQLPNNIYCVEDPTKMTLGYFSVSSVRSKRIFIEDTFPGQDYMLNKCTEDTIYSFLPDTIPGMGSRIFIVKRNPPVNVVSFDRGCVDCTVRGSSVRPYFWDDDKK